MFHIYLPLSTTSLTIVNFPANENRKLENPNENASRSQQYNEKKRKEKIDKTNTDNII